MSNRIQLEAVGLEFNDGGNTIWIHGPGGTLLRVKCTGTITAKSCSAPTAHADALVVGNIEFCVPTEQPEAVMSVERLRKALWEACELADEANGDPSSCAHVIPIGARIAELRKLAEGVHDEV
jgi:hypothetical protein